MESTRQYAPWFALSVKRGCENAVADALRAKGYESFLPLKPGSAPKALFPGYVFCRFDADVKSPIVTTAGVIRILGFGSRPAAIDADEMSHLMKIVRSRENLHPLPRLYEGDRVEIVSGPLRGCCGILTQIDKRLNFVVSVCLLRRSIALAFRPEWVVRAQGEKPVLEETYGSKRNRPKPNTRVERPQWDDARAV